MKKKSTNNCLNSAKQICWASSAKFMQCGLYYGPWAIINFIYILLVLIILCTVRSVDLNLENISKENDGKYLSKQAVWSIQNNSYSACFIVCVLVSGEDKN